ncbi:hypothetical protein PBI_ANJALI_26 [Arthrobacter phage Anjali]|uniref:Uncharacterized protein n=1 Tax=Arthrobacter phage Anjali TaxID=2484217 RepID=A0A3G3LY17_9CAUD|nr:hypothetical protein HWB95_gp26 [Arthrobacter phage Anjali]AYQ98996.1 hypothetical protein PBI_ANJALI_26 [Arthrobacter phage Anjali]
METLAATACVQQLTYTYQAVCTTCHWKSIPDLMKHRTQALADTHNALWHTPAVCDL